MNIFLLLAGLGILFVCICIGLAILKHEWFSYDAFGGETRISMLRQWLNEERITDPKNLVTNAELELFLHPLVNWMDSEEFNQPTGLPKFYDPQPEYAISLDKVVNETKKISPTKKSKAKKGKK